MKTARVQVVHTVTMATIHDYPPPEMGSFGLIPPRAVIAMTGLTSRQADGSYQEKLRIRAARPD